jgi:hypothetical protein
LEDEDEEEEDETEEKEEPSNRRPKSIDATQSRITSQAQSATAKNQARREAEADPTHKFCTHCLENIPLTDYTYNSVGLFGRYAQCKACRNKSERQRRAESMKSEELEDEEEKKKKEIQKKVQQPHKSTATQSRIALPARTATTKNQMRCDTEADLMYKFCTRCLRELAFTNYSADSRGIFGLLSYCVTCRSSARRAKQSTKVEDVEKEAKGPQPEMEHKAVDAHLEDAVDLISR